MKRSLSLLNSESDDDANVNLTPLIDVVFVVLIMFILVAPLVEIDRIQLAHATSEKKADMTSFQENNELANGLISIFRIYQLLHNGPQH